MSRLAKNSICCQGLEFLEGEVKEMRCRTKRSKVLLRFPLLYKETRHSTLHLIYCNLTNRIPANHIPQD